MAGTLVISTISDGTNSTSATNAIQGSAKAWVNFNGVTTATVRASYNVSSVVRNSTGDYTINFTNAMADANYFACQMTGSGGTATGAMGTTSQTSTAYRCIYANTAGGFTDSSFAGVAIFR